MRLNAWTGGARLKNTTEDIMRLEREFKAYRRVLAAIGDETR